MKTILVTGGLGYIGSHTVVELITQDFDVVIIDNLSNTDSSILEKIKTITGVKPTFYEFDVLDKANVRKVFQNHNINAVIHFAALKAVGESVENPLAYYHNNLVATMHIAELMEEFNVPTIVFSSSAMVYGIPEVFPILESASVQPPTNPYGNTKKIGEEILKDVCRSNSSFNSVILRYFNPIGAHKSGLIGEKPNGIPNNLMPYITQTAIGIRKQLTIFGNDYDTKDGTCERDYIHVVDLAKAHVKALNYADSNQSENFHVFNIGTGEAVTVLEIVQTFETENNIQLNYKIGNRRAGDVPILQADVQKANTILKWKAELTLADMVRSSWNFEQKARNL